MPCSALLLLGIARLRVAVRRCALLCVALTLFAAPCLAPRCLALPGSALLCLALPHMTRWILIRFAFASMGLAARCDTFLCLAMSAGLCRVFLCVLRRCFALRALRCLALFWAVHRSSLPYLALPRCLAWPFVNLLCLALLCSWSLFALLRVFAKSCCVTLL